MLNGDIVLYTKTLHQPEYPLASEKTHEVIIKRNVETAGPRIPLPTGPATKLIVYPPGLMPLRSQHVQAAPIRYPFPQLDVRTTTRHVRGNGHGTGLTGLFPDGGFTRVVFGIPHEVLNANHRAREASIVEEAGQPGSVTIATNMAGRGTDIKLGEGVTDRGGLYVLATERHESRRIDNQLRGRSGRQGDPGASRFYISLDDDLMRLFGGERIFRLMERLSVEDDVPIEHSLISRSVEGAQRKVEEQNFEIRKRVLEYDDVMNKQREVIYQQRNRILQGENLREDVEEIVERILRGKVVELTSDLPYAEEWDLEEIFVVLRSFFPITFGPTDLGDLEELDSEDLVDRVVADALEVYGRKEEEVGVDNIRELERWVLLRTVDAKWRDHLYEMDYLREGIGLRALAQKDPLVEYKSEGYEMFQSMMAVLYTSDAADDLLCVDLGGRRIIKKKKKKTK